MKDFPAEYHSIRLLLFLLNEDHHSKVLLFFKKDFFFSILMYYYLTNSICGPVHLPLFEAKAHKFLFCA